MPKKHLDVRLSGTDWEWADERFFKETGVKEGGIV